jgi:hypothetical protein
VPLGPGKASPTRVYRGGTTLILDARTGAVRYAIYKRIKSGNRLKRQLDFWSTWADTTTGAFRTPDPTKMTTDFAALHRGY